MKLFAYGFVLFFASSTFGFVSGPSSLSPGENSLLLGTQLERGKIEPNENRASYQDAVIDIYKVKYTRGFDKLIGLSHTTFFVEYGQFTSVEEKVASTLFYEKDLGNYASIGFSGDILHEIDRQFGIYLMINPHRSYNKKKFSNPRLDLYAFGLTSAFNITENSYFKNLIHNGSGDGTDQNSYIAIDSGLGFRLNSYLGFPITLSTSLFVEADTSQRKDSLYDASFSPAGTEDRVRAFKYGTLIGADISLFQNASLNINHLQKLGGYDARATQIYSLNLGIKF